MNRLLALFRLARPIPLFLSGLTFVLGVSIARYLGREIIPAPMLLGLLIVLFAQVGMNLLAEVFRPVNEPLVDGETVVERKSLRDSALYVSFAALTASAVMAFALFLENRLMPPLVLILGLTLLVILIYSIPPLRLVDKGLGEFIFALYVAYLSPAGGFLLAAGNFHRLLNLVAAPLAFIALATFLVFDFQSYAADLKYERRTLLARIGWERAVPLHHGLVLAAYVLFIAAPLLGFSLHLLWPVFLSLPFALFQIYMLRNISLGAHPIWPLLIANAVALLGLTSYLLTLVFWLH